jgi:glycine hydroxymethyltransferase
MFGMSSPTTQAESMLAQVDPDAWAIFEAERARQEYTLELIASENHVSPAVLEAAGSIFTNKYAEGYPGKRYYGGCAQMDAIEDLARDRAKRLFAADHVNVQPHSGSQANMAVYLAALKPNDTILSLDLSHGGHLTHGMRINFSGLTYHVVHYGVDPKTERFDMAEVHRLAREHNPDMIITGASAYPRTIDFDAFAEVAAEIEAVLMADIAHIAGMVAVGLHPSPIQACDYVTTTTHKTLRGPRGGMILCKREHAKMVDSRVFPGVQGGPLMHVIAAKAVAFGEALKPEFKQYQQQILDNAKALADALMGRGFRLVSGGTDNHLMLVDLRHNYEHVTGKVAETWLEETGIIVNKNMIPFDTRPPVETSGLRLGTPALTTRGMGTGEMDVIAGFIDEVIRSQGDAAVRSRVRQQVRELCEQFPLTH